MRKYLFMAKPHISKDDAFNLVRLIKDGSDYSGMIVMRSLANSFRYVSYRDRPQYTWKSKIK